MDIKENPKVYIFKDNKMIIVGELLFLFFSILYFG